LINFTREELELLNKGQLKRLCTYYDIEVFHSWHKDDIIDAILDYLRPIMGDENYKSVIAESIEKCQSVRVVRINRSKGDKV